MPGGLKLV